VIRSSVTCLVPSGFVLCCWPFGFVATSFLYACLGLQNALRFKLFLRRLSDLILMQVPCVCVGYGDDAVDLRQLVMSGDR
jgi:hypothetical protein